MSEEIKANPFIESQRADFWSDSSKKQPENHIDLWSTLIFSDKRWDLTALSISPSKLLWRKVSVLSLRQIKLSACPPFNSYVISTIRWDWQSFIKRGQERVAKHGWYRAEQNKTEVYQKSTWKVRLSASIQVVQLPAHIAPILKVIKFNQASQNFWGGKPQVLKLSIISKTHFKN